MQARHRALGIFVAFVFDFFAFFPALGIFVAFVFDFFAFFPALGIFVAFVFDFFAFFPDFDEGSSQSPIITWEAKKRKRKMRNDHHLEVHSQFSKTIKK